MTNEQKQLLKIDLSARLPYEVIVNINNGKYREDRTLWAGLFDDDNIWDARPYLRRMSSMTKGEKIIYTEISSHLCGEIAAKNLIDWLNKRHLDYRYLIEEGLALEADEDIYDLTQL